MNPLLAKEGVWGRLKGAASHTSPGPSLVRRGTHTERFIGRSAALWFCYFQVHGAVDRNRLPVQPTVLEVPVATSEM
jgi:hypothetical protein